MHSGCLSQVNIPFQSAVIPSSHFHFSSPGVTAAALTVCLVAWFCSQSVLVDAWNLNNQFQIKELRGKPTDYGQINDEDIFNLMISSSAYGGIGSKFIRKNLSSQKRGLLLHPQLGQPVTIFCQPEAYWWGIKELLILTSSTANIRIKNYMYEEKQECLSPLQQQKITKGTVKHKKT